MSRLTRDETAEPFSRRQILRREWGQGNIPFPFSADHEQDRQPYPVDLYPAIYDDHTYMNTVPVVSGCGKESRIKIGPCGYLNVQHLFEFVDYTMPEENRYS